MARFEVEVNGQRFEVEAPDANAAAEAARQYTQQAPQRPADPMASSLPGPLGAFQDFSRAFQSGATQGLTLGFGDELQAGLLAVPEAIGASIQGQPFDVGQGFNTALARAREADVAAREANPIANVAGNITGNMALGGTLARGGASFMAGAQPTIGSMAGRGALEGLTYGAITGLGTGETLEERLQQAATGGAVGGALGGVTGAVAGALANRGISAATPTASDLGTSVDDAYLAARQSGAVFTEDVTRELVDGMSLAAQDARINDLTAPQASAMLQRIQQKAGQPMTVGEVEDIRVFLNQLVADGGPNEGRVARAMIRSFDDLMSELRPTDFAGGNAVAAMENITEGRRLFATQKKTQDIERLIQRATDRAGVNYSASGLEQALRAEFKNLILSKDGMRGFSEAEQAAIRRVANGGPIENVLRWIGRFSAGSPFAAGVTVGGPAALIGNATDPMTGLAVGGALLGAGSLARRAATSATLNNANLARALIASGGQLPQLPNAGVVNALMAGPASAGATGGAEGNRLLMRALAGQ